MPRKRHRLAAIDVGTNSIHMIVVETERHGYRVIDKEKEMVQLGRGSLGGEPLTPAAIRRGVAATKKMVEIAHRWSVNEVIAVATSAVREARNRKAFTREVEKSSGIKLRVISGEEEADLIFRAVRNAIDFQNGTALCIDVGGGSVEIIVGTDKEVFFTRSEPLGALRLTQEYLKSDPPSTKELERCRNHVRKTFKKFLPHVRSLGFDFCIGTSGTILALAELAAEAGGNGSAASDLRWLSQSRVEELIVQLSSIPMAERVSRFKLDEKRAETIVAGAVVLDEFLRALKVRRMRACSAALREGIVSRALEDQRTATSRPGGGVRKISVLELGQRSAFDPVHAGQVARLALRIFDQTLPMHRLRAGDREALEFAALLHEIGLHVAYPGYHKHTYYLIRHGGLKGFTGDQVAVIANIARYHRKAPPSAEHENFRELSSSQKQAVQKLSAILRIADALDRGRQQAVRDVGVDLNGKRVTFRVRPRLDAELELATAESRARYFSRVFGKKIDFSLEGS